MEAVADNISRAYENANAQPFATRFKALLSRITQSKPVTNTKNFFKAAGENTREIVGYIKDHYNEKHYDEHVEVAADYSVGKLSKCVDKFSRKYNLSDSSLVDSMLKKSPFLAAFAQRITENHAVDLQQENKSLRDRVAELEAKAAEPVSAEAQKTELAKNGPVSDLVNTLSAIMTKFPDREIEIDINKGSIKLSRGSNEISKQPVETPTETVETPEMAQSESVQPAGEIYETDDDYIAGLVPPPSKDERDEYYAKYAEQEQSRNDNLVACCRLGYDNGEGLSDAATYYIDKKANKCYIAVDSARDSENPLKQCTAGSILTAVEQARANKNQGHTFIIENYSKDNLAYLMKLDQRDKDRAAARAAEIDVPEAPESDSTYDMR